MKEAVETIAGKRSGWETGLREIRNSSLSFCPAFPDLAQRWSDWWTCQSKSPLILGQVARTPSIRWDKGFDLLDHPDEWLEMHRRRLEETCYIGESLPHIRADIGPVAMAAFLGAPLHFSRAQNTSWQNPTIHDWSKDAHFFLDLKNEWLVRVLHLMEIISRDAQGRYLVCMPDMSGAIDVLSNLRGSENLCMDLFEFREEVKQAAMRLVDAWEQAFTMMYDLALANGSGITQWVSCWADSPFTVPTCDFNALIGPDDFREVCLPSIEEQARRAGLCVFHLDGPDAARHGETLAKSSPVTAVQYTPGAGTPSALARLPLFRMFQEHEVPLYINTPAKEAKALMKALSSRGLALGIGGLNTPHEADDFMEQFGRRKF